METVPIRSETEYEAALAEIEALWGASYGSPEGGRMDALATLVEAYEQKHYPILPPDPATVTLDQDDTNYLLNIPGMRESVLEGLNTPIEECDDAVDW